jgi:hypothetical protein
LGEVRRKDELEEAKIGEAVERDNLAQKLGGTEPFAWVVVLRGSSWCPVAYIKKRRCPARVGPIIVDYKMVAREEGKLGVAIQGTADEE